MSRNPSGHPSANDSRVEPVRRGMLRVVLAYVVFAALWILVSDKVLVALVPAGPQLVGLEIAKGWAFVGVTATVLYGMLRRLANRLDTAFASLAASRTAARASLEELQRSERRYESIFRDSYSVMLIIDPEDARIVEANSAAERYYGWTREELRSMRITDINMLGDGAQPEMARARRDERNRFEFRHRRCDDSIRDVEVFSGPIEIGDRELLYSIVHDISDRLEAQRELAATKNRLEEMVEGRTRALGETNERLVLATRAKDAFLANMSHELRTPLNSIIGFSGILLQGMAGVLNSEQRRQIEMVNRSGRHLLEIVNDVLDLSRIEAGRTDVRMSAIDVRQVALEVSDLLEPLAVGKGLEVKLDVPDHPVQVWTDRRHVDQILLNLLGNAMKFTSRGSIGLRIQQMEDSVLIEVSDTGPGLTAEEQGRIFGDFVQLDHAEEAKATGTGLGLAISRRLAALIGGRVDVRSSLGHGSVFSLSIPLHPEGENASLDDNARDTVLSSDGSGGELEVRTDRDDGTAGMHGLDADALRFFADAAGLGYFSLDLHTGVASINDEYLRIAEASSADGTFSTAAWAELIHPDDRERVEGVYARCIAGKVDGYCMMYRLCLSSTTRNVLSAGVVLRDREARSGQRLLGVHAVVSEEPEYEGDARV